jgi:phospholipid transport system transporter-binding protein
VLQTGLDAIAKGQTAFDFSTTQQTDSAAVAMLLAWQRAAKDRGVVLQFHNLPASLKSLAQLYDVASLLSIPSDTNASHSSHH